MGQKHWIAGVLLTAGFAASLVSAQSGSRAWWAPGQGTPLAEFATYQNDRGQVGVLNASGTVQTKGHPFIYTHVVDASHRQASEAVENELFPSVPKLPEAPKPGDSATSDFPAA